MLRVSKDYNSIDLLKFIMAIFVVAIHTNPLNKCESDIILTLYECTVRCAVPFFFMASGFFLSIKMNKSIDLTEKIQVVRKYLTKILKMYIVWSIIYLPLAIYGFITSGNTLLNSLLEYARGFILYGENYNSWMLWYLLSTIYVLLFIEFLIRKNVSIKIICIIGGFIFLLGSSIDMLLEIQNNLPQFLLITKSFITKTIVNGRIFTGFLYIPLGMLFTRKTPDVLLSVALLILGFVGNFFFDYIIGDVFLVICCTGLFSIARYISLPNSFIYAFLRQSSTIIYLIHMYVMTIFVFTAYGYMRNGIKVFVIVTFISCLLSFIYIGIINLYLKHKTKMSTTHIK